MKRGEVWTAAGARDYAGKPGPVVIVQDDAFGFLDSVIVCPITTDITDAPLIRPPLKPDPGTGLLVSSRLMADKVSAAPKSKLGRRIGVVADSDMQSLDRALVVILGLAIPIDG